MKATEPGQVETPAISLRELDKKITSRLAKNNIALFNEQPEGLDTEGFVEYYKNEVKSMHTQTIVMYFSYCMNVVKKYFLKSVDEALFKSSAYYQSYVISFIGYHKGLAEINYMMEKHTLKDFPEMREFFTETEFQDIQVALKSLLSEFPDLVASTRTWIEEHVQVEKEQVDSLSDFLKVLLPANGERNYEDPRLQSLAQKSLDSLANAGGHSLWQLEKQEKLGLTTIPLRLFESVARIFTYAEVLHYSGYMCNFPDDPQKACFVSVR